VPRALSPFAAALADLKKALAALRVDWYVFGAQAALIYGAARVTADVDVTLRLGKVTTARLATALKRCGFQLRVEDPAFVRTTRVLPILHVRTSVPADLVIAGPGLEDAFLEHATVQDLGGVRVPVARAEDVIVMKLLAGRDKDLDDVTAILAARGTVLDVKYVRTTLTMVEEALGQSDLVPIWERLRSKTATPPKKQKRPDPKAPAAGPRAKTTPARRRTKK
jgi:hypothetical protein